METIDEKYMYRCIELSKMAKAGGSYPVGSVVVQNGKIVAEGFEGEQKIPRPVAHAEIVAVLNAMETLGKKDLSDCVLYSTKEPCFMCSYLIRQSGIRGVVFASPAGEIGGADSKFPILLSEDIGKWPRPPFIQRDFLRKQYEELLK